MRFGEIAGRRQCMIAPLCGHGNHIVGLENLAVFSQICQLIMANYVGLVQTEVSNG